MVRAYCEQNGIILVKEFVDDGYTGANFNRPDFKEMIRLINEGVDGVKITHVLTKDLSRLGRDMRESSYYAEEYFPEHRIRYIATHDSFDSLDDDPMIPFKFAMNDAYLRDSSRKVRAVLKSKRERGEYCSCPPYGYKKCPDDNSKLVFDEETGPVVQRIFEQAANGDSSRKIALDLINDGVIPPLKYRVLYRDNFCDEGAARMSDVWNYTTVKRILKNKVYLGHTILGKTRKTRKTQKKIAVPEEDWAISYNTHDALIKEDVFNMAALNLGKGTKNYQKYDHVRKSIFSGITKCGLCGYSLCTSGSVYKGEREKYWYLSCTRNRRDILNPCPGTRIRYLDLLELVRQDLNSLIMMAQEEQDNLAKEIMNSYGDETHYKEHKKKIEKAQARISMIDKIMVKLYSDNAEGKIDDDRLAGMTKELSIEAENLRGIIYNLKAQIKDISKFTDNYDKFFSLVKKHNYIETLTRDDLLLFVDSIEIGEKILPKGYQKLTHPEIPFQQNIKIRYKFIGEIKPNDNLIELPLVVNK